MSRFTDLFQEPVSAPELVPIPQEKKSIKALTPQKVKTTETPRGAYRPSNNYK